MALLFFSGYLALATVREYGTGLLLLPALVLLLTPLCERLDAASAGYRAITKAISYVYGCFIPLSLFMLGLLNGVVALVIFIQVYTMLHQKDERNYYHLLLMSFFLLLAAASQTPEASIALVLALFLLSAVWGLISLRLVFDARSSESKLTPDIHRLTGQREMGEDSPQDFAGGTFLYVTLVAALVVSSTVMIFYLTPRVEAGLLGRNDTPMASTGQADSVALLGGKNIQEDLTPVMRVEFPEAQISEVAASGLYWRITTLSSFDGIEWARDGLLHHYEPDIPETFKAELRTSFHSGGFALQREGRGGKVLRQLIYMDEVPRLGMPALDLVQRIALASEPRNTRITWDSDRDFTVKLNKNGSRQMEYEVWSEIGEASPAELRRDQGDFSEMSEKDFEMLTQVRLLPETLQLIQRLTEGEDNNYDRVQALNNFLSGPDFVYSLSVPALPDRFPIDAFINTIRRGHCELYGSALAAMVRGLGIPARLVTGYRGGDHNPGDNSFIVRQSMAHVWVEVLFPEHGWVKFDPAPQSDASDNAGLLGRMWMQATFYSLKARMFWFQNVVGFEGRNLGSLSSLRYRLFQEIRGIQSNLNDPETTSRLVRVVPLSALVLFVVVTLSYGMYRLFVDNTSHHRSNVGKYTLTRDQVRAARLYRALLRRVRRAGIDIDGLSAEEVGEALQAARLQGSTEAQELLNAYNDVRFGGRPLPGNWLRSLWRDLRALRLALPPQG